MEVEEVALIDTDENTLSAHRLVQTAFLNNIDGDMLQDLFNATSILLNDAFPTQVGGQPLVLQWSDCDMYIQHVRSLAQRFEVFQKRPRFTAPNEFVALLSNASWYLIEAGENEECNYLVKVGKLACPDKKSFLYSHLLNTEGANAFELNELEGCRTALKSAFYIRSTYFQDMEEDLLCTTNNLANLHVAEDRFEDAFELHHQAANARERLGPKAAPLLALSYTGAGKAQLGMGLNHYKAGNIAEGNASIAKATSYVNKSYNILVEKHGPRSYYIPR
jgi:hypothetical protein